VCDFENGTTRVQVEVPACSVFTGGKTDMDMDMDMSSTWWLICSLTDSDAFDLISNRIAGR